MALDYSAPVRRPRTLAEPVRHAWGATGDHQRRQDATVRALEDAVEAGNLYYAEHPEEIEPRAVPKRCPCGIARSQCRCEIQRAKVER